MAAVNQCDQCGKVQSEPYDILITIVHERKQRGSDPNMFLFSLTNATSNTVSDLEFCSFECAAMACHLMAAQKENVNA